MLGIAVLSYTSLPDSRGLVAEYGLRKSRATHLQVLGFVVLAQRQVSSASVRGPIPAPKDQSGPPAGIVIVFRYKKEKNPVELKNIKVKETL